jgi:hypothetical protein
MNSDVELTPGFRRWMTATETPVAFAITAYVSPARTVQNRGVDFPVVAATADGEAVPLPPDSKPARIRTTAIVAASRNAAGAA